MSQKGISIIEILVVVGIIGLLVAVIALPMSKFRQRQALENTTNTVVSVLAEARARTLAGLADTNYSVRVLSGSIVLFTGSSYSSSAPTNETFTYESSVSLGSVSLSGGGSDITFDRLKGTTSDHGTITLSSTNGQSRSIVITAAGAISRN